MIFRLGKITSNHPHKIANTPSTLVTDLFQVVCNQNTSIVIATGIMLTVAFWQCMRRWCSLFRSCSSRVNICKQITV